MCDRPKYDTEKYPYLNETEPRLNQRIIVIVDPDVLDDSIKDVLDE